MKYVRWGAGILLLIFLAIQLIPYGRKHTNPAITASPRWNNPQTQSIFARSCAVSWFIQREVDEGRAVFNVSVPNIGEEAEEAAETVSEGEMPPRPYLLLHPSATLSGDEQRAFLIGLMATFGNEGEENERGQAIPSLVREPHDP
jgi:hypothetical protein